MTLVDERRQHRRLPVRAAVHCRRIGRGGFDEQVTSDDLSAGGMLLRADRRLGVGDVLVIELDAGSDLALNLKGLVIATRDIGNRSDQRYVHVAFTGMSADRMAGLARLIDSWDRAEI